MCILKGAKVRILLRTCDNYVTLSIVNIFILEPMDVCEIAEIQAALEVYWYKL